MGGGGRRSVARRGRRASQRTLACREAITSASTGLPVSASTPEPASVPAQRSCTRTPASPARAWTLEEAPCSAASERERSSSAVTVYSPAISGPRTKLPLRPVQTSRSKCARTPFRRTQETRMSRAGAPSGSSAAPRMYRSCASSSSTSFDVCPGAISNRSCAAGTPARSAGGPMASRRRRRRSRSSRRPLRRRAKQSCSSSSIVVRSPSLGCWIHRGRSRRAVRAWRVPGGRARRLRPRSRKSSATDAAAFARLGLAPPAAATRSLRPRSTPRSIPSPAGSSSNRQEPFASVGEPFDVRQREGGCRPVQAHLDAGRRLAVGSDDGGLHRRRTTQDEDGACFERDAAPRVARRTSPHDRGHAGGQSQVDVSAGPASFPSEHGQLIDVLPRMIGEHLDLGAGDRRQRFRVDHPPLPVEVPGRGESEAHFAHPPWRKGPKARRRVRQAILPIATERVGEVGLTTNCRACSRP